MKDIFLDAELNRSWAKIGSSKCGRLELWREKKSLASETDAPAFLHAF